MRPLLVVLFVLAALPARAAGNCEMLASLKGLAAAAGRIAAPVPGDSFAADMRLIIGTLDATNRPAVLNGLKGQPAALDRQAVLNLLGLMSVIRDTPALQDPHAAALVLSRGPGRQTLAAAQAALAYGRCNPTTVSAGTGRLNFFTFALPLPLIDVIILLGFALATLGAVRLLTRGQNRRNALESRHIVQLATTCTVATMGNAPALPGTILDLSRSGAKLALRANVTLPPGTSLTLQIGGTTASATVQWHNAHFAGLRFDTPLSQARLAALLGTLSAQTKTAPPQGDAAITRGASEPLIAPR